MDKNHLLSIPYDWVVLDVDGTIMDSQHHFSPGAEDAIRDVKGMGILPILASGRPRFGIMPILDKLGLGPAHIGAGGAYASGPDGRILFQYPAPTEHMPLLIEQARDCGLDVALHTFDQIFLEGSQEHEDLMKLYNGAFATRVEDVLHAGVVDPCKITLFGTVNNLSHYRGIIEKLNLPVELVNSTENFLEINHQGVSKGSTLKEMAGCLGVSLERVIAIGDQFNDISMFNVAGFSIAMGNAPEEVKRAARLVAPTNDEGGLAWALRTYLLN
jgi:Cof subfamily protein (haloacid dehalogenase superfamily)